MDLHAYFINTPDDAEKLVLPGLIFCSGYEGGHRVYSLSVGWWHWGFGVAAYLYLKPSEL